MEHYGKTGFWLAGALLAFCIAAKAANPPAASAQRALSAATAASAASAASAAVAAVPAPWRFTGSDSPEKPFPASARKRSAPDPGLSSRHLPVSISIGSEAHLRAFRTMAARVRTDSTRHWEIKEGRVRISYDMLQDLAAGGLPDSGGRLGDRAAAFLTRINGMQFHSTGNAHATYLPDDKWLLGSPQWALKNTGTTIGDRPGKAGVDIGIERVWDKFAGSDSLVVAVVDAGFDFNHPILKGRNWINQAEAKGTPGIDDDDNGYLDDSLGWDFVEDDNLPQDRHGHGTFVSSVIASGFDSHDGIAGILAEGRIMPVRVLDASGHGDESRIAKGIQYAVENGARVINFSIGGSGGNPDLRRAFQAARDAGIPIVVAAGNDARDIGASPSYPAAYNFENMLLVAAHDHAGLLCGFSNFGKSAVHLAAPGELILVAGVPSAKVEWKEDFEGAAPAGSWSDTAFAIVAGEPAEGGKALAWKAGNSVIAYLGDTLDLTGVEGATLGFRMEYKPVNGSDALIVEGNKAGTSVWTEIAVYNYAVPAGSFQVFGTQDLDGSRFRLRFRTSLASRYSSAARVLKIDDAILAIPDPEPPKEPVYTVTAGTSLAAPHVTAYLGLQRLACDRMGVAWSRALALTGVVPEPSLAGKVSTNGRLDAYKGLEFYLSTLPDFQVLDSNERIWKAGEKVEYTLNLSPSPSQPYVFSASGLPDGALLDGAGMITWTPGAQQGGEYSVRLEAQGPTVLRKQITFTVQDGGSVALAAPSGPQGSQGLETWRWAGQTFRLRPELARGRHQVEVFGIDAAGKVQLLKRGWMDAGEFAKAQPWPRQEAGGAAIVFKRLQIRVDGVYLSSGL